MITEEVAFNLKKARKNMSEITPTTQVDPIGFAYLAHGDKFGFVSGKGWVSLEEEIPTLFTSVEASFVAKEMSLSDPAINVKFYPIEKPIPYFWKSILLIAFAFSPLVILFFDLPMLDK